MWHFRVLALYCTAMLLRRRLARFRHALTLFSFLTTSSLAPTQSRSVNLYWKRGRTFNAAFIPAVAAVVSLPGPVPHLGHRQGGGAADGIHAGLPWADELGGPAKVAVVVGGLVGESPHVMHPAVPELLPVKRQPLALQDVERITALGRVVVPPDELVFGTDGCWQ